MPRPEDHDARLARARLALEGLSVGDAFGESLFGPDRLYLLRLETRRTATPPWRTTDDTEMACAIHDVLAEQGSIDPDRLAAGFARRYALDPRRGYGAFAHDVLEKLGAGAHWMDAAFSIFDGAGSFGNGGAMRVAPVGGYFADDPARTAEEARRSAIVTHGHPEGQAGAIAVALAAAAAARGEGPRRVLEAPLEHLPPGGVRRNVREAVALPLDTPPSEAAEVLGNGSRISAQDTVGWCLWCAARHLGDYEAALWTSVGEGGDLDTNAAIVGGIVALAAGIEGIPPAWREAREPLRLGL